MGWCHELTFQVQLDACMCGDHWSAQSRPLGMLMSVALTLLVSALMPQHGLEDGPKKSNICMLSSTPNIARVQARTLVHVRQPGGAICLNIWHRVSRIKRWSFDTRFLLGTRGDMM